MTQSISPGRQALDDITRVPIGQQSLYYVDRNLKVRRVGAHDPLPISVAHEGAGDALGRLRMSPMDSLQSLQNQYNSQPVFFDEKLVSNGTTQHLPDEASVLMSVTADGGSRVVRQARQYSRYFPGRSQLIRLTTVLGDPAGSVEKRVGYFDDDNGIFFRQLGDTYAFVQRSSVSGSPVDTVIEQDNWNQDRFDGLGFSSVMLDGSKAMTVVIDLEWMGAGEVRVGFQMRNEIIWAHRFNNSNSLTSVYMTTANLPGRFEITGDDANADSMKAICLSVDSEGGPAQEAGIQFSAESGLFALANGVGEKPVLAIRPLLTFNGMTNRVEIKTKGYKPTALSELVIFRVRYNPTTIVNPTWMDVDTANSAVEFATFGAGGAFTGGSVVDCLPVPAAASIGNTSSPGAGLSNLLARMPFTVDIDGLNPDELIITAENLGAAPTDLFVCAEWEEVY